jgi:hypothetical protein
MFEMGFIILLIRKCMTKKSGTLVRPFFPKAGFKNTDHTFDSLNQRIPGTNGACEQMSKVMEMVSSRFY